MLFARDKMEDCMIQNELSGKKILILAGADVHIKVVKAAKALGVYTIVTDYLNPEDAPAKQIADEYWMLDIKDIEGIVEKCRQEHVDGVIAFCIDPAQIPYQRICEKLGVPCYGTAEQFKILTEKRLFKNYCKEHGVDVIPEYSLKDAENGTIVYPVLVKPSESRGSRGQTVCHNINELKSAIEVARKESGDGQVLIERYMLGAEDMSFAYAVIDGEPYLVKIGDRILGYVEDNLERQQIATILPSRHAEQYIKDVQPAVISMVKSLEIKFGAIFLQGFWENGRVYMYDPGFRFPGSDYDVITKNVTGFDPMSAFVRFALTGDAKSKFGNPIEAYNYAGHACMILSVACRAGKIAKIEGFETIEKNEWIQVASLRHHVGDVIPNSGDVKQRVAEFIAYLPDKNALKEFVRFVYANLKILDDNGNDMIVSRVLEDKL